MLAIMNLAVSSGAMTAIIIGTFLPFFVILLVLKKKKSK